VFPQYKLQVKTPSEHTYSHFWAELSKLLGEKIPVVIVGLEPGTPGLYSRTLISPNNNNMAMGYEH